VAKTRSIDFASITLRDALDFASLVEEEARERYGELADQMEIHHNPDVARFFSFMRDVEQKHEERLAARRRSLFGDAPRQVTRDMIFDVEAPEYDEARANMTVRHALDAALRSETKAFEFFDAAVAQVKDDEVRKLFTELRKDELEHQELVKKELAKLPPSGPEGYGEEDEPVVL